MKRTIAPTTLVIVFAIVFVLGAVPSAQAAGCSNATLQGSFGYTSVGNLIDPNLYPFPLFGPFAEVGRQTFDGRGNTEAAANLSANGNPVAVTISGAYTVNPDCTGTMTLYVLPFQSYGHAYFVIDEGGAEIRLIFTDPGLVESRTYKKQFQGGQQEW